MSDSEYVTGRTLSTSARIQTHDIGGVISRVVAQIVRDTDTYPDEWLGVECIDAMHNGRVYAIYYQGIRMDTPDQFLFAVMESPQGGLQYLPESLRAFQAIDRG